FDLDPQDFPLLTGLGRNLTAAAADGLLDPVIGRDRQIDQLLDVLARRRSNNPVLIGPPGVGKTAVVEALAARFAAGGEGVQGLEGRLLIELSAGAMVSGTGVRGALSQKLRRLREEVARTQGRVILFIDEIHAVVGGGEGPDDLASELKGSLARGELPCVGATTEAEYRKHFERDPALVRRFSPVHVEEPSAAEAVQILRGVAERYETHHRVAFEADALEAAVEFSVRYLVEGCLPDKAIGVMDMAAARTRRRGGSVVDRAAIASVISEQARVSEERLLLGDGERLLRLEAHLAARVVGHRAPLSRISDALRKGAAGFRGRRPLGTFLLLGPTGVGKTETAKAIAEIFFPSGAMSRFDMSELSEAHSLARLLGAPPGYIGHEEGGMLTEAVRRRPYQLLLLDEIEKAHPEVLLALLPLLDEGRLTDGRGRTVDFTNTIIVMTSNLGAAAARQAPRIGFGARGDGPPPGLEAATVLAARRALPPELWNRIDEPLYFGPLAHEEIAAIAEGILGRIGAELERERGITLEIGADAISSLLAAGGYDPELGARPMRRIIGRLVESPLASMILAGALPPGTRVRLRASEGGVGLVAEPELDAAE
ncbi:MAG: ATP-dependent Clp protease ATP-binding subunit, partial [Myxococcales bacterium]|nr:ATP-dependent Clp protease ATP-binding subunit [Myxococcales bacterium]